MSKPVIPPPVKAPAAPLKEVKIETPEAPNPNPAAKLEQGNDAPSSDPAGQAPPSTGADQDPTPEGNGPSSESPDATGTPPVGESEQEPAIPPCPATDPEHGDLTPAYVEWYAKYHTKAEFLAKYAGRINRLPASFHMAEGGAE